MGYDPKPVTYTGLHCTDCFSTFDQVSTTGTVTLCQACAKARSARLFANSPDLAMDILPVPGDRVVCGLRFEIPKNERAHEWTSLGIDTRHAGEFGEFVDMEVFACMECGRDKQKMIRVPRVAVNEAALNDLIEIAKLGAQFVESEYSDGDVMQNFYKCVEALRVKNVRA